MSETNRIETEPSALVALHNELADELNAEKERLSRLKGGRELEEITGDPSLNYLQGKVNGFELAMSALQAFIVTSRADAAGILEPNLAEKQESTE
jgi:hypothetical protein